MGSASGAGTVEEGNARRRWVPKHPLSGRQGKLSAHEGLVPQCSPKPPLWASRELHPAAASAWQGALSGRVGLKVTSWQSTSSATSLAGTVPISLPCHQVVPLCHRHRWICEPFPQAPEVACYLLLLFEPSLLSALRGSNSLNQPPATGKAAS